MKEMTLEEKSIVVIFLIAAGSGLWRANIDFARDRDAYASMKSYIGAHPNELPAMTEDCQKKHPLRHGQIECDAVIDFSRTKQPTDSR